MIDLACAVEGCGRPVHGRGWCNSHYRRWKRRGDPGAARIVRHPSGPDNANWTGDQIDYRGAHWRVRLQKGKAKDHQCVDCGRQASEWSYDRLDPNEKIGVTRGGVKVPYSTNPRHYQPRCLSCHRKLDAGCRTMCA